MQILYVWVTCLIVCAVITVGWYISNTVVNVIASSNMDLIGTSGPGYSQLKLLEYVNIAWGPVLDAFVILWAIISSAKQDVTSSVYG
jgi:hypothetical protein